KIAKLRCRLFEVPISYRGRGYDEGKKITWRDGLKALFVIVRFWLVDDLYEQTAGLRTLRIMEGAGSYNRWLITQCKPYLRNRIMEVGAGVGNITKFLLTFPVVTVTDYLPSYVDELKNKFSHLPNMRFAVLDLLDSASVNRLAEEVIPDTVL